MALAGRCWLDLPNSTEASGSSCRKAQTALLARPLSAVHSPAVRPVHHGPSTCRSGTYGGTLWPSAFRVVPPSQLFTEVPFCMCRMLPGSFVQIQKHPVKSLLLTSKPSPQGDREPAQSTAHLCPHRDLSPDMVPSLPTSHAAWNKECVPPASSLSVTVSTAGVLRSTRHARGLWKLKPGSGPYRSRA